MAARAAPAAVIAAEIVEQGAGLGIAISRAIAELSGGQLAIDSSPALGTTIAVSLPLRAERTNRIAAA